MLLADTGWVPVASGTVFGSADCSRVNEARVIVAASGTNGAASAACGFLAGAESTVTWGMSVQGTGVLSYSGVPLITGSYAISAPTANATSSILLGAASGAAAAWCPDKVTFSALAGASSYVRVIVEGHL